MTIKKSIEALAQTARCSNGTLYVEMDHFDTVVKMLELCMKQRDEWISGERKLNGSWVERKTAECDEELLEIARGGK